MRRLLVPFGTCLLVWTLGWIGVSQAWSAEPADAVPSAASVVVRWKSPVKSLGKLADLVDAVQPGAGERVKESLPGIGQAIGNPGLVGVDTDQDMWAIIFAEPQVTPTIVFVITAKDVDDVKDALPANFEVHAVGKLVAYSEDEDALEQVRQRIGGDGKPLWARVDAASKKLFDASDVSALINIKQLTTDFSDELDEAEPQLDATIDQLTNAIPESQRPQLEAVFNMYRSLGKMLLGGIRDTNSFVVGVTFAKGGVHIEDRIQMTEGTPTAKFLASQAPGELPLISKLPANKQIYVGLKGNMSNMIEWSMNLTKSMLTDATDEQKAQIDAIVKEMANLKYDEMAMYLDVAGDSPAFRGGAVSAVTPTKALRDASHKIAKAMAELRTPTFTQTTKLEPNAEKIGGVDVDRLTIKQEFEKAADPLGVQKKIAAAMFGEEGMQQLVMYQANRTLQTTGGGKAEMQNLVTSLDSTKSNDAALATARKGLTGKANILVCADVARLLSSAFQLASQHQALPIDAEGLKGVKLEPSFFGYALTCESSAVRSQLEIPVLQLQNIARIAALFGPPR